MRNTTVPLLLILLSFFADAQDTSLSHRVARLTTISRGENVLQHADPNFQVIELNEDVFASYLTNQGVEICRRLAGNIFVVRQSPHLRKHTRISNE
jgi:hypothetical protein